ncbi:MAG: hypothetical protein CMA60_00125 [Euryarchaeota archaeon]|nr:hypothetical protein [Euryarchaeota archaeon]|tara:strand:+ start:4708 stop:5724 length:1017 start_codon:yes stop_codon:yes gene_type:complete
MGKYTAPGGGGGSATLTGIDDQSSSNDDQLTIKDSEIVINEDSDSLDFRVESNGDTHKLFVDASENKVGIGEDAPEADLHVTSPSTGNIFVLECTDNGAASGPDISMIRDSSSPVDNDFLGRMVFKGRDDAGQLLEYGNIKAQLGDATNGSEGFNMFFQGIIAGTGSRSFLGLRANGGINGAGQAEVTINENSQDIDFRIESDNSANAFFVEGSSGKVGLGVNTGLVADLDLTTGKTMRATALLTVALSSSTTLSAANHAGRYVFVTGGGTIIIIPDNQDAGTHFTLISNDGNGFTLRTGSDGSSGDNMNGSQADISVGARNGVTCISTGTDYVVLGV